jgi:ribulose-phosphate 3-epimerase
MDGLFVPNISFGPKMVADIRKHTDLPLDVHLMIVQPERYLETFAKAGADYITVHVEATEKARYCLERIRELGVKSGIVISPDTAPERVFELLDIADMVLVMSVYPGFGGQKFIPSALDKIKTLSAELKKRGLSARLEIDGGVGIGNVAEIKAAGADTIVAGSSVFGASDASEAIRALRNA